MVLSIATDVVIRNSTGATLPGMLELAESSLVVSVFFGLAFAGVKGEHVAVTLLTDRLNKAWSNIVNIFVWSLSSAFLLWAVYATTLQAIDSTRIREERFGLVRWPTYPLRWLVVIGLVALLLVALCNLARSIRGRLPMGANNEIEAALRADEGYESAGEIEHSAIPEQFDLADRALVKTTVSGGQNS